jgi:hypothetical protein
MTKHMAKLIKERDGVAGQIAKLEVEQPTHPVIRALKRAHWGLCDQIAWIEAGNSEKTYRHKPEVARELFK